MDLLYVITALLIILLPLYVYSKRLNKKRVPTYLVIYRRPRRPVYETKILEFKKKDQGRPKK